MNKIILFATALFSLFILTSFVSADVSYQRGNYCQNCITNTAQYSQQLDGYNYNYPIILPYHPSPMPCPRNYALSNPMKVYSPPMMYNKYSPASTPVKENMNWHLAIYR